MVKNFKKMFFPSSTPHPTSTKLLRLLPSTTAATADLHKRVVAADPGAAALFRQQDAVNLEVEVTVPVHATAAALHKHLLVAIDCSGSMGGSTDYARLAGVSLAGVSEVFGMVDSATFLPFGSDTAVLRHDGEFPERTDASLRGLSANRGGTHFAPLLRAMRAAMDDRLADPAARCEFVVCVLSDGEPTDRDQYPQAMADFQGYSMALALRGHAVTPHMMGLRQGCSMAFLDELARALGNVDGTCQFASTGPELENMLSVAVASSVRSTFAPSFDNDVALLPTAPARQGAEPLRLQLPDNGLWVESNSGATSTWTGVLGEVPRAWLASGARYGKSRVHLVATVRVDPRGAPTPAKLPLPEGLTVTSVSDASGHASNLVVGSLTDAPSPGDYLTLALAGESRVVRVVAVLGPGALTVTPRVPNRRWLLAAHHSGYGAVVDVELPCPDEAAVDAEVPVHRQLEHLATTLGLRVARRVQQLLVAGAPAAELDRALAGLDVVLREMAELTKRAQAEGARTLRSVETVNEREALRAAERRRREAVASTVAMLVACQREGVKLRGLMAAGNSSVALYREASRYLFSRDLQAGAANLAKLKVGTLRRAVAKTDRNSASVNAAHDEALALSTSEAFADKLEASVSSALNLAHVTPFCGSLLGCFRQKVTHRWPVALCTALQVSRNSAVVLDVHHLLEVVHMNGADILYADLKDDQEHLSALATPAAAPAGGAPRDDVARYFDVDADPFQWEVAYSAPVVEMSAFEAAAYEKAHGSLASRKERANAVGVDDAGNPYNACWPIVACPLVWRESGLFKLMNGFCSELVTGSRTSFQSSWRGVPFWVMSTAALRAAQGQQVSERQALAVLHALETACYYAVTSDPDPLMGRTACFGFDLRGVQALVEVVEAFFADPANRATSAQPSFLELLGMVPVYALATGKAVPWEVLEVEAARRAVDLLAHDARKLNSNVDSVLGLLDLGLAMGVTVPVAQAPASTSTFDALASLSRHVDPSSFVKLADDGASSAADDAEHARAVALAAGGSDAWLDNSDFVLVDDEGGAGREAAAARPVAARPDNTNPSSPSSADPREPLAAAVLRVLRRTRSTTSNGSPYLALLAVRAVTEAVLAARSGKRLLCTEMDAGLVLREAVGAVVMPALVEAVTAGLKACAARPAPELAPGLLASALWLHSNDRLLREPHRAVALHDGARALRMAQERAEAKVSALTKAAQAARSSHEAVTAFLEARSVARAVALLLKAGDGAAVRRNHCRFYPEALAALLNDDPATVAKVPLWRFKVQALVRGKVFLREADPAAWPAAPPDAHVLVADGLLAIRKTYNFPGGEEGLSRHVNLLVVLLAEGRLASAERHAERMSVSQLARALAAGPPARALANGGLEVSLGGTHKHVLPGALAKVFEAGGAFHTLVANRRAALTAAFYNGDDPSELKERVAAVPLCELALEVAPELRRLAKSADAHRAATASRVLLEVNARLFREDKTVKLSRQASKRASSALQ